MFKTESYKKGILFSSGFNVVAKGLAFLQQLLIAYYFGAQDKTDIFFFTYNIILFSSSFFMNFTSSILIPENMRLRIQVGETVSMKFMNFFIWGYGIIGILVYGIFSIHPVYFFHLISSFDKIQIENSINIIRWCLPIFTLNFVTYILTDLLVSYKYFTMPMMANTINYTLGLLFIYFFHSQVGVSSVAQGLLIGYIINVIFLLYILRKKIKWNFFIFDIYHLKSISQNSFFSQVGYCVYLLALYIPQYIFSGFPPGVLSAINYAQKTVDIPAAFLVNQVVNVSGIKFNELCSLKESNKLQALYWKVFLFTVSVFLLLSLFLSSFSETIISILFKGGTLKHGIFDITVNMTKLLALYIPYALMYALFIKLFYAFQKVKYIFYVQAVTQILSIGVLFLLINKIGVSAYPFSRILPYMIVVNIFMVLIKKVDPIFPVKGGIFFINLINVIIILFLSCRVV
ncbi:lipid II flippase MurJ [Parabacteroides pacaensis]|uniref:lipid II flippase MurJ n=1 Tax=Parabacteroides pacaensis TaxID=2086575 RepID=UPI000D10A6D8|nr:lipid II flippase MurJ [Parabacteroides pacaensis]